MGQAIPTGQSAVVLRSHFNHLRALLAVALIAVAGLTVAVVILATDSDEVGGASSAQSIEPIRYGAFNPATGRAEAAEPAGTTRYDGGPEEGSRGVVPARQPNVAPTTRYDGGPEEGSRGAVPALQSNVPPTTRYDGGPEEGTADVAPPQAEAGARPDGGPEEGSHLR
jgi:hypothetical protein